MKKSNPTAIYLTDHLGSIRTTIDQTGTVIGYDDFDPFGNVLPGRSSNAGTPNDLNKFTGHERDQEGGLDLDYMLARNYDSELGRFYSVDPLSFKFNSTSPYSYVLNNPLIYSDPTGMDTTWTANGPDIVVEGSTTYNKSNESFYFERTFANLPYALGATQLDGQVLPFADIAVGAFLAYSFASDVSSIAEKYFHTKTYQEIWDEAISTGFPRVRKKEGNMEDAIKDFELIPNLIDKKIIPGIGSVGKLPNGDKVVVRNRSKHENLPTLELQKPNGDSRKKIRYEK